MPRRVSFSSPGIAPGPRGGRCRSARSGSPSSHSRAPWYRRVLVSRQNDGSASLPLHRAALAGGTRVATAPAEYMVERVGAETSDRVNIPEEVYGDRRAMETFLECTRLALMEVWTTELDLMIRSSGESVQQILSAFRDRVMHEPRGVERERAVRIWGNLAVPPVIFSDGVGILAQGPIEVSGGRMVMVRIEMVMYFPAGVRGVIHPSEAMIWRGVDVRGSVMRGTR